MKLKRTRSFIIAIGAIFQAFSVLAPVQGADKKPNIVVIWGDDVGY